MRAMLAEDLRRWLEEDNDEAPENTTDVAAVLGFDPAEADRKVSPRPTPTR